MDSDGDSTCDELNKTSDRITDQEDDVPIMESYFRRVSLAYSGPSQVYLPEFEACMQRIIVY